MVRPDYAVFLHKSIHVLMQDSFHNHIIHIRRVVGS